jgi:WD40 repeat protein
MAAGCRDNSVRVWDVETQQTNTILQGAAFAVAFSPDSQRLLTASYTEVPQFWDLATHTAAPVAPYPGNKPLSNHVYCTDVSMNCHLAALGFDHGEIQLIDLVSGSILNTFFAHAEGVTSLALSPLCDKLVSGGADRSVAIWDARTGQLLERKPAEHRGSVCAVAFNSDATRVASGCGAGTLKLWDATTHYSSLITLPSHESVVRTLCFSPDRLTLASGSEDKTVRLWKVSANALQQVASINFYDQVQLVLFSPDGNNLAVVTRRGSLHLLRATPADQVAKHLAALRKSSGG